jgi:lysophospholipase L1-like esterase
MRYLAGLVLALALGVIGCSETAGTGGSAGDGGTGGVGGEGGNGEPLILQDVHCVRESEGLPPERWEAEIAAYEDADLADPANPGSIVFVGSSSIRLWQTLSEDMAPMPVLNRGFGGSVIADATHFADRIILVYEPSAVVLYAGDNDIFFGLSGDCTLRDFEAFAAGIHAAAPGTPIYYISIKPSPARWAWWEEMLRANELIEARTTTSSALHFIDVSEAMLDQDGEPIEDLYSPDGLHMSDAGYDLWTSIVQPQIATDLGF